MTRIIERLEKGAERARAPGTRADGTRRPLCVLFFHWNGDLYGASRSLLRLTSRLARARHRPVVVLGNRGPVAALLTAAGVEVRHTRWMAAIERTDLRSPLGLLRLVVRALVSIPLSCVLIARIRPDVVHTNASVVLTPAMAARIMGRPHVWHIRETFVEFPRLWAVFQRFVAALSTRIVCISESVASQFDRRIRRRKVDVVHNGIPRNEVVPPGPERIARLRMHWGLQDATTVGVVGRINLGRKGQHLLVEAAARLVDSHASARFLVVGSPYPGTEDEELRLRDLIRTRGLENRFVLTGEMGDLPLIYGLLDVVVVPSPVPETFGNTAPEAMAYGVPVVGSNLGGTAEIVEHGVTGYLFPPGDPGALAACLDVLLADPRRRAAMGEAGRRSFAERFEFERCYGRMVSIFDGLTAQDPRRSAS
jgi:glycosyltransferase involved in cell wall biosynthesis